MPELPEVEVTARHLHAALSGRPLLDCRSSGKALRLPVPVKALQAAAGSRLWSVYRRAKFLVLEFDSGWMLMHLGMSGVCRIQQPAQCAQPHDHVVLGFGPAQQGPETGAPNPVELVFNDPRRFGALRWAARSPSMNSKEKVYQLLGAVSQGLEPFDETFNGGYLHQHARGVRMAIKPWLMQGKTLVGVGNIYACEALFSAGIHPARAAGRISRPRFDRLAVEIGRILKAAIEAGGSTIRDFQGADGQPGRYGGAHQVYGRAGLACPVCGSSIRRILLAQRSSFYCHVCQR